VTGLPITAADLTKAPSLGFIISPILSKAYGHSPKKTKKVLDVVFAAKLYHFHAAGKRGN
jgi:hypothetical protein